MFKFDFDIEVEQSEEIFGYDVTAPKSNIQPGSEENDASSKPFSEHTLDELIEPLPPILSFSPLQIRLQSGKDVTISRRDLFDARFQLISQEKAKDDGDCPKGPVDLDFVEAPSDLLPKVYEGGLKTWECSLDLAACLQPELESGSLQVLKNQRIIELGCGTAVPSLFLLQHIFAAPPNSDAAIALHLQDYNDLVLRLVTLPNVILAWYMTPASAAYRSNYETAPSTTEDEEPELLPPVDPTQSGELPITPALTTAFLASLKEYGVELRFFSGSWETFDLDVAGGPYDAILTSETIYRLDSLSSLLDLMWKGSYGKDSEKDRKTLEGLTDDQLKITDSRTARKHLCLVAAKQVYFGVGGGVSEFTRAVEEGSPTRCSRKKGGVQSIWEKNDGVKRTVLRVAW